MGNQLVSLAPSQIYPVEQYIQDIQTDAEFESSLGSTRFFKVAKCRASGGNVVVKVFVIHDPSLPMRAYQEKLNELNRILAPTFNCLPYTRITLNEKAGFIIRQFVKYTVYDRLSTRPFLTLIEKKWIGFQLMAAVDQAHGLGVCHGDIKLENIMLSSWNWLLLTDFAPFKPIFLPEDNPADFSYFFDTSRRRTCYIAPERFKSRTLTLDPSTSLWSSSSQLGSQSGFLPDDVEDFKRGELTPAMDIFSLGCALAELFTDGAAPFDFSQLLAYRADEYSPVCVLDKIEDINIRRMVESMIQKDPTLRLSASEYLQEQRGLVFPEYFYSFLQSYMRMFSHTPLMSSDQKIARIYRDLEKLEQLLQSSSSDRMDSECLLLLTTLVTASIRDLKLTISQLQSIKILCWLAERVAGEIILDRILPFIVYYLSSGVPPVRKAAIEALVHTFKQISSVPRNHVNTFPEYVLPAILPLCQDPSINVRAALAKNLADLAELSIKFLDLVTLSSSNNNGSSAIVKSDADTSCGETDNSGASGFSGPTCSYDAEVNALHEPIRQAVTLLLEDQQSCVKQVLVQCGGARLAVFFGRQRANDVLLSHMITFLNDKNDSQLRFCFFDNIAGIAAFVGWHCSTILKPLLQQGLADPEEFVVARAINAMASLACQGLLEKVSLFEMLRDTLPFLMHPNIWIRQAAVGMVVAVSSRLDPVDVQVKIGCLLKHYLRQSIVLLDDPAILLSYLREPIPRPVLDAIIKYNDVVGLMAMLEERQTARRICRSSGQQVVYIEMAGQYRQLFARLAKAGMLPAVEDEILGLSEYILKVARQRSLIKDHHEGIVDIGLDNCTKHTVPLISDCPRRDGAFQVTEDWQGLGEGRKKTLSEGDYNNGTAPCRTQLSNLIIEKKKECLSLAEQREKCRTDDKSVTWKPRGNLVAHLTEHKKKVTGVVAIPDTTLFASTSTDGTLRIWDCHKMEGRNIANKARQVYNRQTPLDCLSASRHNFSLGIAARDGSICVFNIEKQSSIASRSLNLEKDGTPVQLHFQDSLQPSMLFYTSSLGVSVGWDLRKPGNAIRFETELRYGLTTAMCVDDEEFWLTMGTSEGVVSCWDLRFGLQVSSFTHPGKARVRRLTPGLSNGQVLVSVQGNNEVGCWNLESGSRHQALWASAAAPLSLAQPSQHSILAMRMSGKGLITGGTDCKLRFWNMSAPAESAVIGTEGSYSYRPRLVDGTEVLQETGRSHRKAEDGKLQVDIQHQDWVTDILIAQTTQKLLITSGNDGVIKIWK